MKNVLTYSLFCTILLILNSCSLLHKEVVRVTPNTAQSQICGKCHAEEYREWQQSAHRNSYISNDFKEQSDNYGDEECLTCHDEHFEQWEQPRELINQSNPEKTILSCQVLFSPFN
jgi:hypothetical protein